MFRPECTFENFVVGSHNELAFQSALRVANDGPSTQPPSNPLFIYGLGFDRLHLAQAIANRATANGFTVEYVTFRGFAAGLKKAQQVDSLEEFRQRFRTPDFLVVDDIQAIIHNRQAQQEFFHTLDDLIRANHQVVLSSDRSPNLIPLQQLGPEIHSRFVWGLVVDIQEKPQHYG